MTSDFGCTEGNNDPYRNPQSKACWPREKNLPLSDNNPKNYRDSCEIRDPFNGKTRTEDRPSSQSSIPKTNIYKKNI